MPRLVIYHANKVLDEVELKDGFSYAVCRGDTLPPTGHIKIEVTCPKISRTHLLLVRMLIPQPSSPTLNRVLAPPQDQQEGTWRAHNFKGTNETYVDKQLLEKGDSIDMTHLSHITIFTSKVSFTYLQDEPEPVPTPIQPSPAPVQPAPTPVQPTPVQPTPVHAATEADAADTSPQTRKVEEIEAPPLAFGALEGAPGTSAPCTSHGADAPGPAALGGAGRGRLLRIVARGTGSFVGCVWLIGDMHKKWQAKLSWLRERLQKELPDTLPLVYPRGWIFSMPCDVPVQISQEKKFVLADVLDPEARELTVMIRHPVGPEDAEEAMATGVHPFGVDGIDGLGGDGVEAAASLDNLIHSGDWRSKVGRPAPPGGMRPPKAKKQRPGENVGDGKPLRAWDVFSKERMAELSLEQARLPALLNSPIPPARSRPCPHPKTAVLLHHILHHIHPTLTATPPFSLPCHHHSPYPTHQPPFTPPLLPRPRLLAPTLPPLLCQPRADKRDLMKLISQQWKDTEFSARRAEIEAQAKEEVRPLRRLRTPPRVWPSNYTGIPTAQHVAQLVA